MMDALRARWERLCQRYGVEANEEWDVVISHYSRPERAYHNLDHISDCLMMLDRHLELARNADALEMAIWLHDIIYDPHAADNEEQSAQHARELLSPAATAGEVVDLILATRHSETSPPPGDASLMVDIDLSILGAEAARYRCYASAIRQEYLHVPDDAYATGRTAVLSKFLARPRIFTNDVFRDTLEIRARENLAAEIRQLAERLPANPDLMEDELPNNGTAR